MTLSPQTVFFKKATDLGIGSSALSIWKLVHLKKKFFFNSRGLIGP